MTGRKLIRCQGRNIPHPAKRISCERSACHSGNYVKFISGDSGKPSSASQSTKESFRGADQEVPPGSTRVSLIDPKSGDSLWSDVRKTNNPKAAFHMLDGLREAFERRSR